MGSSYIIWNPGWKIIPYHLFWIVIGGIIGYLIRKKMDHNILSKK